MAEMLADDTPATIAVESWAPESGTVGTPICRSMRGNADLGVTHDTSTVIATRGERLVLMSYPLLG